MTMNRRQLNSVIYSPCKTVEYLQNLGVLKKSFNCKKCKKRMNLVAVKKNDRYIWKCMINKCKKQTISIRKGSVFYKVKIELSKILEVIYELIQKKDLKEININYKGVNTIMNYFNSKIMEINNNKIGGYNKWVEVDESAVARRKYNVGRLVRTIWIVGGIERGSVNMFFRITKSRNSDF
ncbi:hypothetical protein SLOPH_2661 [Spraguea lophii 42_110]|uniref:ISXO2-like transposase domain-containing protein n=1 Tax=Spraguea lophii (strain 42_110) TaxID=1358809 RepID=S7W5Q1_SPRLO|nr:hypothetical protein SLOPH_2661 [Spraguea lophii 42_110]